MNQLNWIFGIVSLLIFGLYKEMDIGVTAITDVRVHADHDSEGALFNLSDGNIMHIYRTDPGTGGDHVGAGGKLVKRTYNTSNGTWGSITDIFSDGYDDRNIHGGVTDAGRLVVFFSRYNVAGAVYVDHNFMYSDDDGVTWSARSALTLGRTDASAYGQMIYVPTKGYMMSFQRNYYSEILFSADGSSWGGNVVVGDYISATSYNLTEAAFQYIGSGKLIAVIRDNSSGTMYQVTSSNYGVTWSTPVRNNMVDGFFTVAPKMILKDGYLIILCSDRRSVHEGRTYAQEQFHIVVGLADTVFTNPLAWQVKSSLARPDTTLNDTLYGYPSFAELPSGRFLVVFTDRYDEGATEDCNLYQFELTAKDGSLTVGGLYPIPVFKRD